MEENNKKKIKNPLRKRISREFLSDWRKYLVVGLFLILTIGFVSGMYVANESMMKAADAGVSEYKLEGGHFELEHKADENLLSEIESGKKADIKQYYLDEAKKELDKTLEESFAAEFEREFASKLGEEAYSKAYDAAYEEAYKEAWKEVEKEIDEKYAEAEEAYELNDSDFEPVPVSLYENFYRNEEEDSDDDGTPDGTIRVYPETEEVNLACLMEGSFPEEENEIAIDRMHADNAGIKVGDTITVGGLPYRVVGLIAYVNYATLHEENTDLMFDALNFDVAMVTKSGFARLNSPVHYNYAWRYAEEPAEEKEEKSRSDDFLKVLLTQTVTADNEIEDFVPRYANQAVNFATEDMGSDEAMGGVLLYILIAIIAFIFAITISNTITREAQTIGTLRASGYSRGELVRHYLSMPIIVTVLAAGIGNILGYTLFKNVVVSMYYNSYSLPTYETIWNADAFFKTTLIPIVLMFVVNLAVILKMMRHTPLQFLRHDLKKRKRKKAMRLPGWKFFGRFRLRIMLQNIPNYIILFAGIFFVMVMLAMAVGMPDTLKYYKDNAEDMMFAKYQYILKSCEDEDGNAVDTKNEDAEKFGMCSLQKKGETLDEEISVYGISDNSRYLAIADLASLKEGEVYISTAFQNKYGLKVGDTVTLDERYENRQYQFEIAGTYDRCQGIAVFMPIRQYQTTFELEEEEFSGYMSDTEITDIGEEDIATVITKQDITKMCDQLDHSMGAYMQYFQVLCILLSAVLIYLLTKLIIEKNENAISMTKILGYENREIVSLYLFSTTLVIIVSDIIGAALGVLVMKQVWKAMMLGFSGWFTFIVEPAGWIKMFVFVLLGYLIVVFFDFNRIKKIPMDEALKNVE
ncbi:MAG: FtsX-like permease family protein [Bacteroidales bacterium]|nr:FtsX-like permease family protein [Clostridium sp.]MCM1202649.1 FtsX-like permease family protein [Bacteroidales bacterium]